MSLIFICKSLSAISDDTLTGLVPNVASLSKHVSDIVRDDRIINNDIIGLIETQINLSDSTSKLIGTLNFSGLISMAMLINFYLIKVYLTDVGMMLLF